MPNYKTPRYSVPRGPRVLPRRTKSKISSEGLTIIDQLVAARIEAGMTQHQVAEKAGMLDSQLADIERGSHKNGPSITLMVRYARAVGLSMLYMDNDE